MDFFKVVMTEVKSGPRKGEYDIIPDFQVRRSEDLMVKGKSFYAIWDEQKGMWSTDEYDVQRLVDEELQKFVDNLKIDVPYSIKWLRSSNSGSWRNFRNYIGLLSDNAHDLDSNLTFLNTEVKKDDYVSHRLNYALADGECPAYDELIGTLYSVEERAKAEWCIGAIVAGDSKFIQKFAVLYGPPGGGKGTLLDIIRKLFKGYTTEFDAKALGNSNATFSTSVFATNPLVAISADTDMSRIGDNTKINSIVSHEPLIMNEKYKPTHSSVVNAFLWAGTNQPVKITDAKSGLLRRVIDINPSGLHVPENRYAVLVSQIEFELGAIAAHCLKVYRSMGKNYFSGYRPTAMMLQTDEFYNFIEYFWDTFKEQDVTSLAQAYGLYKQYCAETGIDKVLPMYKVREELKNYFKEYKDRGTINGAAVRSWYGGFTAVPFKTTERDSTHAPSLVMDETESLLDVYLERQPATLAVWDDELGVYRPAWKWKNVKTTLSDIDTSELHYVKVPEGDVVIDFDLVDESGEKDLVANLEAASSFPASYAELSQGGNGVHLHYHYDGDVSKLSPLYARGIEVKTFTGNASLRRRLSRCNSLPIATLKEGMLPLKDKEVLADKTIQDERHLRALIKKALQKDVNPGTKSNIDFIKKITDEAYRSGMSYDVTDLRPKIIAFANGATNQSALALKIVTTIHWKSELVDEDAIMEDQPEKPHVIYDVEVYPNLFVIGWKYAGAPKETATAMINPTPQEVDAFVTMHRLEGFYVRRYDNHILYAAMLGYPNQKLFELSQKIILAKRSDSMFGEAYNLSYADTWDYASIKKSLKRWQIDLGLEHMESNIPWDEPVPDHLIPKVVEYCLNDVHTTDQVREHLKSDFAARQMLAELTGLSVNHTTQNLAAKLVFGDDRNPQSHFNWYDLSEEFPGYKFENGKSTYRGEDPSEGGYVYEEEGYYTDVAVLDVASMHPTSIIQINAFGKYTQKFKDLLDARLAIKHKDYDRAAELFDGRLKPYLGDPKEAKQLSHALKIVINIVYGLTSAKFENKFKDLRNRDNIVAKRGALFMIDLKHFVQEAGFTVAHIKTDSIKIPHATQEIIDEVMQFGRKYGYDFEHEATYDKFCLVNKAVYVAHYGWAEDESKIDSWEAVGAQFQHPYIFKKLFTGDALSLQDYMETRQVTKGVMYLDLEYDRATPLVEGMHYIGKSGQFIAVEEGTPGAGILYRKDGEKLYSVTGTKGYFWVEAEIAKTLGDYKIDYRYYEKLLDKAETALEQYVSLETLLGE
jgi:hypothetical protein